MGRRRYRKKKPAAKHYRVNHEIQAPQVKLIDPDEGLIGIVSKEEAIQRAMEKGLNLIEVSPKENPPVVKILDFGKFKYNLEKKKQKNKAKKTGSKGIRLSLNMAAHDLTTKEKQATKFLSQGYKVRLEMLLRGRERAHTKRAFEQMTNFITNFEEIAEIIQPLDKKGGRIIASLQPKN